METLLFFLWVVARLSYEGIKGLCTDMTCRYQEKPIKERSRADVDTAQ